MILLSSKFRIIDVINLWRAEMRIITGGIAVLSMITVISAVTITTAAAATWNGNGVILENGSIAPSAIKDLVFSCGGEEKICGKIVTGTMRGNDGVSIKFVMAVTEVTSDGAAKGFLGYGEAAAWRINEPVYFWIDDGEVSGNELTFKDPDGDTNTFVYEGKKITGGGRSNRSPSFRWSVVDSQIN